MIKEFKENEARKSGVIYNSTFDQIKMLYDNGQKELAGELAISAIELVLTGDISSDDFTVKLVLQNMKAINEKAQEKYDKAADAKKEKKKKDMKLEEIAELSKSGLKQSEIAEKLNTSQQVISYRLGVINADYKELLQKDDTATNSSTTGFTF